MTPDELDDFNQVLDERDEYHARALAAEEELAALRREVRSALFDPGKVGTALKQSVE